MDVLDRLASLRTGIEDHSVAGVGDALINGHLPGVGDKVNQQVIACCPQLSQVRVMGSRDYQDMDRRLRIDIAEGNCAGICGYDRRGCIARRDTAEQAIRHGGILTSCTL